MSIIQTLYQKRSQGSEVWKRRRLDKVEYVVFASKSMCKLKLNSGSGNRPNERRKWSRRAAVSIKSSFRTLSLENILIFNAFFTAWNWPLTNCSYKWYKWLAKKERRDWREWSKESRRRMRTTKMGHKCPPPKQSRILKISLLHARDS